VLACHEARNASAGVVEWWIAAAMLCLTACSEPTADTGPRGITPVTPLQVPGVVATDVSPAPAVRVTDRQGAPVAGVEVAFSVVEGGGTVTPSVVRTDAAGLASATWTLGRVAARNRLVASVTNLAPVEFSAAAAPGPVARIEAWRGDWQKGVPNSALAEPLTVYVGDAFGNAVAGMTVTFDVLSGGGIIEPATAVIDSSGLATSGAWTLGATAGAQKARARVAGVEAVFTADAWGNAAAQLQLVVASLADNQIYAVSTDGTVYRRLTSGQGRNMGAVWSPDGRRIAFVRVDTSQRNARGGYPADIYLMDADGSNVVRRTIGSDLRSVAWSPDGRELAVSNEAAFDDGINGSAICIISVEGDRSSPRCLASDARAPVWSPNGKKIAYIQNGGDWGVDAIFVINTDGTDATRLTSWEGGRQGVTWSPDGARIASSVCQAGRCEAFAMNADGSDVRRLTDVGNVREMAWSPDGMWIAVTLWTSSPLGSTARVAYIPAEGGAPRVVTSDAFAPAWRP
jgi:hypothetical protein